MPHEIDLAVGATIQRLRRARKMSQSELASELGLSFQQVQKYEKGRNRVSASCLFKIAKALNVEVADLFSDVPDAVDAEASANGSAYVATTDSEAQALLRNFRSIPQSEARRALLNLSETMATG